MEFLGVFHESFQSLAPNSTVTESSQVQINLPLHSLHEKGQEKDELADHMINHTVQARLAYSEMYIALARLFRHFNDLTIEPRSQDDLAYDDLFNYSLSPCWEGNILLCRIRERPAVSSVTEELAKLLSKMPRRTAISLEQKTALRVHKSLHPALSHNALKQWFEAEYKQKIAQSSVSEILSKRYAHLDKPTNRLPSQKRYRREHWPELEEALFMWIQQAETSIPLTREAIRHKAQYFWENLSVYKNQEMPAFSNGWLHGFQTRRAIKNRTFHGEAASARDVNEEINCIQMLLKNYAAKDIFNCDETGLFWKMIPDKGLFTRSLPCRKKEKARITAHYAAMLTAPNDYLFGLLEVLKIRMPSELLESILRISISNGGTTKRPG
ncbi:hypothetical protein ACJ73_01747 [Blastomyces percursus]|uniref:HTH CENPB-type domain-containing protein n=1 Tax=Blastomyces percursus TaxID=1658174 RepID=A0A1J9R3A3_9EURO|nr:hypothetical protein ACJ73_01747 [Blastomyces percursus]